MGTTPPLDHTFVTHVWATPLPPPPPRRHGGQGGQMGRPTTYSNPCTHSRATHDRLAIIQNPRHFHGQMVRRF